MDGHRQTTRAKPKLSRLTSQEIEERIDKLRFEQLLEQKQKDFAASLPNYTSSFEYEQESRQLLLQEKPISITVHVSREDYVHVTSSINLTFFPSAAQAGWTKFLAAVRVKLNIEFIDSIYDKFDKSPVHRTLTLKDGGYYIVRQREESAVLEVLNTGKAPAIITWPITQFINAAKESLSELDTSHAAANDRILKLVMLPEIRKQQRLVSMRLLQCTVPKDIPETVNDLVSKIKAAAEADAAAALAASNPDPSPPKDQSRRFSYGTTPRTPGSGRGASRGSIKQEVKEIYDQEIDLVSIYRLSLESLNRLAVKGYQQSVAHDNVMLYVLESMRNYMHEVDITIVGLKFLSDMVPAITRKKPEVLHLIMDIAQRYTPPSVPPRERVIRRLLPTAEELEEMRLKAEEAKLAQMMEEEARALEEKLKLDPPPPIETTPSSPLPPLRAGSRMRSRHLSRTHSAAPGTERNDVATSRVGTAATDASAGSTGSRRQFNASRSSKRILKKASEVLIRPNSRKNENDWSSLGQGESSPQKPLITPLPIVPGVKFRGLEGKMQNEMVLTQVCLTLYRFVSDHYVNRQKALDMWIYEELAEIALICKHVPKILIYGLWILDKLFEERIEEFNATRNVIKTHLAQQSTTTKVRGIKQKEEVALPSRIHDAVIIMMSLIAYNIEMADEDRDCARRWLEVFNDTSPEFIALRKRGLELSCL